MASPSVICRRRSPPGVKVLLWASVLLLIAPTRNPGANALLRRDNLTVEPPGLLGMRGGASMLCSREMGSSDGVAAEQGTPQVTQERPGDEASPLLCSSDRSVEGASAPPVGANSGAKGTYLGPMVMGGAKPITGSALQTPAAAAAAAVASKGGFLAPPGRRGASAAGSSSRRMWGQGLSPQRAIKLVPPPWAVTVVSRKPPQPAAPPSPPSPVVSTRPVLVLEPALSPAMPAAGLMWPSPQAEALPISAPFLGVPRVLSRVIDGYSRLLEKYYHTMSVVQGTVLGLLGDLIAQGVEAAMANSWALSTPFTPNLSRTFNVGLMSLLIGTCLFTGWGQGKGDIGLTGICSLRWSYKCDVVW